MVVITNNKGLYAMFNEMQKMFDPQAANQMLQNFQQVWSAEQPKQNAEMVKKLSNIWAETFSSCYEKQVKMAQQAMESSASYMREISSAKGIEEVMNKQANWSKKYAETCQNNAQALAETMQKGQTQATDLITKTLASNFEASQEMVNKAAAATEAKAS